MDPDRSDSLRLSITGEWTKFDTKEMIEILCLNTLVEMSSEHSYPSLRRELRGRYALCSSIRRDTAGCSIRGTFASL